MIFGVLGIVVLFGYLSGKRQAPLTAVDNGSDKVATSVIHSDTINNSYVNDTKAKALAEYGFQLQPPAVTEIVDGIGAAIGKKKEPLQRY